MDLLALWSRKCSRKTLDSPRERYQYIEKVVLLLCDLQIQSFSWSVKWLSFWIISSSTRWMYVWKQAIIYVNSTWEHVTQPHGFFKGAPRHIHPTLYFGWRWFPRLPKCVVSVDPPTSTTPRHTLLQSLYGFAFCFFSVWQPDCFSLFTVPCCSRIACMAVVFEDWPIE